MNRVIERTNPTGATVYGIRYTDETGKERKKFSRKWTKTHARTELEKIEQKLALGVATRVDMTVEDLFHDWHRNHAMLACTPVWQQDSKTQFKLRIEPIIGHRKIDTVTRSIVTQMMTQIQAELRKKNPTNPYEGHATVNKTLTVVKSMFTYAVKIEQLAKSPADGVPELEEAPVKQRTAWPLECIEAIALAARELPKRLPAFQRSQQAAWVGERDFAIIMLAALTGLRQSEVLGLHWDEIDDGWIHVSHKLCRRTGVRRVTKSRRGTRRVPIRGLAAEILGDWRAIGAHARIVFPNQSADGYLRAEHFYNKTWLKARQVVGAKRVRKELWNCATMEFHELRHTFISRALAAGRHLWEVAKWAGDHPDTIEKYYGHYIPDSLGDTAALDKALSIKRSGAAGKPRLRLA